MSHDKNEYSADETARAVCHKVEAHRTDDFRNHRARQHQAVQTGVRQKVGEEVDKPVYRRKGFGKLSENP